MPTYEYACQSCGKHFDVVQAFSDDPVTECPSCEGPVRKVFGAVGIVFKGSGFYKTDSRDGASKSTTGSSAGGDKSPASESTAEPKTKVESSTSDSGAKSSDAAVSSSPSSS